MREQAGKAKHDETWFPNASEATAELIEHLRIKIDIAKEAARVKIETAAKDAHGNAIFEKNWSDKKEETVSPVAIVEEKAAPLAEPLLGATS